MAGVGRVAPYLLSSIQKSKRLILCKGGFMHIHEHNCSTCKHECLHYCPVCDKVYCCKCGKEWGGWVYYSQPYYPTTIIYPYTSSPYYSPTTTITYQTGTVCEHSH